MELEFKNLGPWIFGSQQLKRFTQDSPVMPDVWLEYGREPNAAIDLLLEPHADSSTAELAKAVLDADHSPRHRADRAGLQPVARRHPADVRADAAQRSAAVELVAGAPVAGRADSVATMLDRAPREIIAGLKKPMREQGRRPTSAGELSGTLIWFVGLVGRITWEAAHADDDQPEDEPPPGLTYDLLVDLAAKTLGDLQRVPPPGRPLLWSINRNRPARPALWRSRNTIKADAATLLFDLHCDDLCWAVVDSGIDATHPAFTLRGADGKPTGRRACARRTTSRSCARSSPAWTPIPTRSAAPPPSSARRSRPACAAGARSTGRCSPTS